MGYPDEQFPVGDYGEVIVNKPVRDTQDHLRSRIERHLKEADRLAERVAFLDELPTEPVGDDGTTVIWFEKQMGSRVYTYAAVRTVDGLWSTTGPKSPKRYRWTELIQWIFENGNEDAEVWFANGWETL